MSDIIRVGYISAINYTDGTAQVVYKDRDNAVSPYMPFFSNEFDPPPVETLVYVVHLENGGNARRDSSAAVCRRKPAAGRRRRDLAKRFRGRKLYSVRQEGETP